MPPRRSETGVQIQMLLELLLLGHIDSKWRKQETVAIAIMFSYRDSSLIS